MSTGDEQPPAGALRAVVTSVDQEAAIVWLDVSGLRLAARLWGGVREGATVEVVVRPEDVVLCTEVPGLVSTRNVLPGEVRRLVARPEGVLVELDLTGGGALAALVTRGTVDELGIRAGRSLVALLKATAIVPLEAVTGRVRVQASLVGPHGPLPARTLELLGAIHATGSVSAAARRLGISYRSAWLWVEKAHAAWGAELVAKTQGGSGGGGAVLSPAAHGLLDLARRCERAGEGAGGGAGHGD